MIKAEEWVPEPRPGGTRGWLVLLADVVRHNKPDEIVFVGKEGNMHRRFEGWSMRMTCCRSS